MQKRYGFVYVDNDDLGKETKKRYKKIHFIGIKELFKVMVMI